MEAGATKSYTTFTDQFSFLLAFQYMHRSLDPKKLHSICISWMKPTTVIQRFANCQYIGCKEYRMAWGVKVFILCRGCLRRVRAANCWHWREKVECTSKLGNFSI